MKTSILNQLWALPIVGAFIFGWVAVMPIVGDAKVIGGQACPGWGGFNCSQQIQKDCAGAFCSGNYTYCQAGGSQNKTCSVGGVNCAGGPGCSTGCKCQ